MVNEEPSLRTTLNLKIVHQVWNITENITDYPQHEKAPKLLFINIPCEKTKNVKSSWHQINFQFQSRIKDLNYILRYIQIFYHIIEITV